jgi:nitrate reductase gamma subunit
MPMSATIGWLIAGPFMYLAIAVFVAVTLKKVLTIAAMPRHLRWDLYPIAHEGPEGSAFQKAEFWKRPRSVHLAYELAEMAEEIFLLKRTFLYNRKMWNFSYPMHAGFYLIIGWLVLVKLGAVVELVSGLKISSASTVFWAQALNAVTVLVGVAGLVLGLVGCLGLLWMRCTDENLRDFSSPVTFLNLYLLIALFGVGLAAWLVEDSSFVLARGYAASLMAFKPVALPPLMTIEALLFGAFLIYLPFSRMLHFAAKYFFYHNIMWDDEPLVSGGGLDKTIGGYLHYKAEWSAPHLNSGGSWLEQATTNPAKPKEEGK